MEAAVAAEDYVAAAAERDAVDALMLRGRKLEVLASVEARKVLYRPGECVGLVADVIDRDGMGTSDVRDRCTCIISAPQGAVRGLLAVHWTALPLLRS